MIGAMGAPVSKGLAADLIAEIPAAEELHRHPRHGFSRRLVRAVLDSIQWEPGSDPLTVTDLLIALLTASDREGPVFLSTGSLAARADHLPWLVILRSHLRAEYAIEHEGRAASIDTPLDPGRSAMERWMIRSRRHPREPWEENLPPVPPAPPAGRSRVWATLEDWLTSQPGLHHPVLGLLVNEWTRRQMRYRRVFASCSAAVCGDCPHGGCCSRGFARLRDVVAHRIRHGVLPLLAERTPLDGCPFQGPAGCTLIPGPLPAICCDFHCASVLDHASPEARRLLPALARDADRIGQPLRVFMSSILPEPPGRVSGGWGAPAGAMLIPAG